MAYKYEIIPTYQGRKVCLPDRIVKLTDKARKKDLEYLFKRGYEGVVRVKIDEEKIEGEVDG